MTKAEIFAELRRLNPDARDVHVVVFADALMDYRAAQANIDEHGAIVIHPRTGAPITNPYLAVREQSAKQLLALKIDSTGLWT